jgi:hypothetical protein
MRILLAVALCTALPPANAQVYECPGRDGPVYSDQPCEGGKELHLPPPNVIDTGKPEPASRPSPAEPAAAPAYLGFAITWPEEEGSIHSNTGSFTVSLSLDPALREGDVIQVSLDGTVLPAVRRSLVFDIAPEEWEAAAGEDQPHVLAASILDASGSTVMSATPVRFYVHHASVLKRRRLQ